MITFGNRSTTKAFKVTGNEGKLKRKHALRKIGSIHLSTTRENVKKTQLLFLRLSLPSTLIRHENGALFLRLALPSTLSRKENAAFISTVRPTVHTYPSRKRSFISTVSPSVHTVPSRKRSFCF